MKTKFMRIGLLLCTCAMALGISAFAAPKSLGTVVARGDCKFYSTAVSKASAGKLHKGVSADVTSIDHGRYQISLWGESFWVNQWNVGYPKALTTTLTAKKGCNVYAKADNGSKRIAVLPKGKTRKALAYDGTFIKIKMNGKTGWVNVGRDKGSIVLKMKTNKKADGQAIEMIFNNFVKSFIGKKFVYGAAGPDAFDTSGFVYYCLGRTMPNVPRTLQAQYQGLIEKMPRSKLGQSAIAFFDSDLNGTPDFAAVVLNKNEAVGAINAHTGVRLINLNDAYYVKHFLTCGCLLAGD